MSWTSNLELFSTVLKKDGVVIFPTDTVWGLGCLVTSSSAIQKLYQIKQREPEKPTAILIGSMDQAREYGQLNQAALELAQKYWPGALTLVVKATQKVPEGILGPNQTVGLRFPNFSFVQDLTNKLHAGLATGSANFAGGQPPLQKQDINPELLAKVDAVFEGECGKQPPSTIVDCTTPELNIIRQGSIKIL